MHKHVVALGIHRGKKRKRDTKHFVLRMAWLQLPQTSKPIAPSLFQLCSSYCLGCYTWACLVPSVRSFTMLGTCRIPLPGQGLLGVCVGWGSVLQVRARPMRCEGFGMASEPRGEQHRDHRIPGTAAETSLLLPHTPEGRQRLKTRLSQSTHKKFKTCLA